MPSKNDATPSHEGAHQGPDRQPVDQPAQSNGPNPDPHQAATPDKVQQTSRKAKNMKRPPHAAPDALHPEPRLPKKS